MPKVTQAFQDRQAARILAAAERCFARNGFHASSMDEIIATAGVSSSTVYRYYPEGKRSLIRAVSAARIDPLLQKITALATGDPPPSVEQAFLDTFRGLHLATADDDGTADGAATAGEDDALDLSALLAVNAWTELSRDPHIRDMVRSNYAAIGDQLTTLVRRWLDEGTITPHLRPEETAALIRDTAFGLIAQQVITGRADVRATARRLHRLLTPRPGRDEFSRPRSSTSRPSDRATDAPGA